MPVGSVARRGETYGWEDIAVAMHPVDRKNTFVDDQGDAGKDGEMADGCGSLQPTKVPDEGRLLPWKIVAVSRGKTCQTRMLAD